MKRQKSCGPRLGKLVHQLPGVVTFAYDLRFRRVIARWKGIIEEIHFGGSIIPLAIIENLYLKKPSFRPSKWPRKLKPAKNSKLPKLFCQKICMFECFEIFYIIQSYMYFILLEKGGWPPISTWIMLSYVKKNINLLLPIHRIHPKERTAYHYFAFYWSRVSLTISVSSL
jgi:hypothetical protein